jgi:pyruvate,water dikinase
MDRHWRSSGDLNLDDITQGLRLGDNVVWQVDALADYVRFAQAFAARALADGMPCVYVRFAPHTPLLAEHRLLERVEIDPESGFDVFSTQVHRLLEERGRHVAYVFDSLSTLVQPWATDELLANFFQVTCPYLYELETIAYFSLMRGSHAHDTVAKIAATTQVMIDVYHVGGRMYIHPIKALGRYSPRMFIPHQVDGGTWAPIFEADRVSEPAGRTMGPSAASIAPWDSVYAQLLQCREQNPAGDACNPEVESLKGELRRMLMGDEPHLARLADHYLSLDDLLAIRGRLIGSGRIGGKAAGMLLARSILCGGPNAEGIDFAQVLEDHDSFYVGSDVFFTFMVANGLFRRRLETQRLSSLSREQYEELEAQFLSGEFPEAIVTRFREMLAHYGETPIIVRSSSLFEDGFGHTFAGKYRSEFCANQGDLDARLQGLMSAVKRVYASALSPDALAYRRKQGLLESDEQMAILVQRVSGRRYKDYYFPPLAGVAFSHNIYAWSDRIDPHKGMLRLVFGLGTRAVDRVEDYPRMIALSHPHLRPEVGEEIARYAQRSIDLIDLRANALRSEPLSHVIDADYPNLHLYASQVSEGYVHDAASNLLEGSFRDRTLVLTFNKFVQRTPFVSLMRTMLQTLGEVYGHAIDTEFTLHLERDGRLCLNLLQCRSMSLPGWSPGQKPNHIPSKRVLFRANRMAGGGIVRGIGYVVYVDPAAYATLISEAQSGGTFGSEAGLSGRLGRLIGQINHHPRLRSSKVMMMGPGRWGSSNPALGVHVTYADIDNTAVLVEIAREERGYLPEVSFGTHFFQDLVEDQIIYLPLYPDDPAASYHAEFFSDAPNILTKLLPEAADDAFVVKVIDVAAASGGLQAHVVADPAAHEAVCYLGE